MEKSEFSIPSPNSAMRLKYISYLRASFRDSVAAGHRTGSRITGPEIPSQRNRATTNVASLCSTLYIYVCMCVCDSILVHST